MSDWSSSDKHKIGAALRFHITQYAGIDGIHGMNTCDGLHRIRFVLFPTEAVLKNGIGAISKSFFEGLLLLAHDLLSTLLV